MMQVAQLFQVANKPQLEFIQGYRAFILKIMNKHDFIERTAAGLRRMDVKPDYLLIVADRFNEWEYDEPTLCNIPVIKSHISVNSGYGGNDYPATPCFISLNEKKIFMQVNYFQRGFEEKGGSF